MYQYIVFIFATIMSLLLSACGSSAGSGSTAAEQPSGSTTPLNYFISKYSSICLCLSLTSLTACVGGGTVDIMGEDDATFVGSVSVEKKMSDRSSVDISYLATAGSNSQYIGTGIQFNGNRVSEGRIKNRFTFQALTAHYDYTYFLGQRFKLTAAPALQFSYFDLQGRTEEVNPTFYELFPAYGLRLGASFDFSNHTRAVLESALYDQKNSNTYTTSGAWLEHTFNNDLGFNFGYSTHKISDGNPYSSDACRTADAEPQDCDESGFAISSTGLHFGLSLKL